MKYDVDHAGRAVRLTKLRPVASGSKRGLLQAPRVLTKSGNHIDHSGGPVVLTKLRSVVPGSERGLLQAPLGFALSVHHVVGPGFSVRLTRSGGLGPKDGSVRTPFVDTHRIRTVVHVGGPVCPAVHRGAPVPEDGPGPAPGLTAPFRTRVPLTLGSARSGAPRVRARGTHVPLELGILRPHFWQALHL
jgi:hypothetical protein